MAGQEEEVKEWKLLCEKTLEEDTISFSIETDTDGAAFAVEELIIIARLNAASKTQYLRITAGDGLQCKLTYSVIATANKIAKIHIMLVDGKMMDVGSLAGNNEYVLSGTSSYGGVEGSYLGEKIEKITVGTNTEEPLLTSGSKYIIYGR